MLTRATSDVAAAALRRRRCRAQRIEVSLCGDAGGDPRDSLLLASGLRCLSMAPALVGRAKLALAGSICACRLKFRHGPHHARTPARVPSRRTRPC